MTYKQLWVGLVGGRETDPGAPDRTRKRPPATMLGIESEASVMNLVNTLLFLPILQRAIETNLDDKI